MANPGYPQMQPMQPMQPMGGPMMGPPGMRPGQLPMPVRRGTPKAVPVIVSAGLAVGVFCGLLFGLGTGEVEAKSTAAPKDKQFVGTKIDEGTETAPTAGQVGPTVPKSVADGTLKTGTMKEPKGSAAVPATGSGSGAPNVATVAVPTIKMAKLIIAIKPDTIKDAKITVDGAEVKDNNFDVAMGDKDKKEVTIVIKATGYKDLEQKLEVEGETKVEYQLVKARSSSSSGSTSTPKRPDPPGGKGGTKKGGSGSTKKGGGGLIDI